MRYDKRLLKALAIAAVLACTIGAGKASGQPQTTTFFLGASQSRLHDPTVTSEVSNSALIGLSQETKPAWGGRMLIEGAVVAKGGIYQDASFSRMNLDARVMPLMRVGTDDFHAYVVGGGELGVLVSAIEDIEAACQTASGNGVETSCDKYSPVHFGLVVGGGIVLKRVAINARYTAAGSSYFSNGSSRLKSVELFLGFRSRPE